jgi:membrane associated rhomboid family serine protease
MLSMSTTPATFLLLATTVVISLIALYHSRELFARWSFDPSRVASQGEWYRFVSGAFLHGGMGHLAFNMLTLYFFGPVLEIMLGTVDFLVVYFGSLFVAHLFLYWKYREAAGYTAVGASGAISGVIFGFCLFFPFEKIYLLLIPIGIPAILFAVGFAAFSYYAANQPPGEGLFGRVAHEAHLGGAVAGLILTMVLEPRVLPGLIRQIGGLF